MGVTLVVWLLTIVSGIVIGTILCWRIESSGVARWGASGRLFNTGWNFIEQGDDFQRDLASSRATCSDAGTGYVRATDSIADRSDAAPGGALCEMAPEAGKQTGWQ